MKFFKSILCAAVAMGIALPTMAQTSVQGVVLSKDKEPLMGVTVTIPAQNIAVVTNSDGAFRIDNAQPGKDKLVINSIGHREFSKTIIIEADTIQHLGTLKLSSKEADHYNRISAGVYATVPTDTGDPYFSTYSYWDNIESNGNIVGFAIEYNWHSGQRRWVETIFHA